MHSILLILPRWKAAARQCWLRLLDGCLACICQDQHSAAPRAAPLLMHKEGTLVDWSGPYGMQTILLSNCFSTLSHWWCSARTGLYLFVFVAVWSIAL